MTLSGLQILSAFLSAIAVVSGFAFWAGLEVQRRRAMVGLVQELSVSLKMALKDFETRLDRVQAALELEFKQYVTREVMNYELINMTSKVEVVRIQVDRCNEQIKSLQGMLVSLHPQLDRRWPPDES